MHYRNIWEDYHQACLLPGIEIHHIDGNRSNNHPDNLLAVSVEEHYNIHKSQGDWAACTIIAERLSISTEEYLEMKRKAGLRCFEDKTGFHKLSSEEKAKNGRKGGIATSKSGKGIFHKDYDRSKAAKENPAGAILLLDEMRKRAHMKVKGSKWMHKDGVEVRVQLQDVQNFIDDGYTFGQPSTTGVNNHKHIKVTDEQKEFILYNYGKMSLSKIGRETGLSLHLVKKFLKERQT